MRRMITEKDVEKLESIKPSEIEKLGAMQDPKTAIANQILTADGTGKAVYKKAATGTVVNWKRFNTSLDIFYKDYFTDDAYIDGYSRANFPGYVIAKKSDSGTIEPCFESLPSYVKSDETRVYIAPTDYFLIKGKEDDFIFGIKQAVWDQFVADTADKANPSISTGVWGRLLYEKA